MSADQFSVEGNNATGIQTAVTSPIDQTVTPNDADVLVYTAATNSWGPGSNTSGSVTNVTATLPLVSSGGATPDISITGTGIPNANLTHSTIGITAGTGLTGGGTPALGGSTSLSVSYGTSAGTSTQGNDTRLPPTPSAVGKTLYDTGSAYQALANGTTGQVHLANTGAAPSWGNTPINVQAWNVAGTYTWNKPAFGTMAQIRLLGPGGGGGGGTDIGGGTAKGGGGGGGGSYVEAWVPLSSLSNSETVIVGAGGTAGSHGNPGTNGNPGTANTTFGSKFKAGFGTGGTGGSGGTGGTAGTGGTGMFSGGGGGGGASSADGNAANTTLFAAGVGGGGGAGAISGNKGGSGGVTNWLNISAVAGGQTDGAPGGDGSSPIAYMPGTGGGGGAGSQTATAAGKGGNGSNGAGGGGGGAGNGTGGNGGSGGDGFAEITVY